jgi:[protein-PII] uridylyltransferase
MTGPPHDHDLPRSFTSLLDGHYDRARFLQGLKRLIAAARERIYQEHASGARGRNVVRHLTALVDDVVRTVFQFAKAEQGGTTIPCTLLALGGYGRGELNPHSDVDLMFLGHKADADDVILETLYLLWDVGYTLGYSTRTIKDAVRMAHTDLTAQTAMLEARFIDGDAALFQKFQEAVGYRRFSQRQRRTFARQKRQACRERHATYANTVNLMEPNIKESPGGLRDYHTALWLAMACYEAPSLADMVDRGLLRADDRAAVETALDFLFRVRNALHYHYGRKNDLLSVDVQEKLATSLGFEASAEKQAVEHFLNTYYVQANIVYDVCCTLLEAVAHTYQPRLHRLWQRSRRLEDGFLLQHGYLTHEALPETPGFAESHPLLLMQAFAVAHSHDVPFAPELSGAIKSQAHLLEDEQLRRAPDLKALFFRILALPRAAPVLRAMHRHGLLAAYLPEFGALTCLVQYDLYHRYTVDEHTLHSIEALESLATTTDPALRPLASLYQQTPDQGLLKFALLLHDLGKDVGPSKASHVHRSGELAEVVCDRLDLPTEQRHFIQIMVVNHLVMNHLAQRRDITDPKIVAEFAQLVETVTNLEQLYLLTFADTSAVGPDVWTTWKGALLADLYRRSVDYLVYQTDLAPSKQKLCERLQPAVLACLDPQDEAAVDHFLDTMPIKYLMATPAAQIAKHVRLTQPALSAPVMLDTHQSAGFTTATICVEGRRGVFAMIAGALSKNRFNILGAQIFTSTDGIAVDTLQVETADQTPVSDTRVWQQVEADLLAALAGQRHFDGVLTQRRNPIHERRFQTFALPPHVEIDNALSDGYTVIEIQTQDRLGLLYKLTRLLYELGLDIALAKISTEANKAIDVFYVTDANGAKVVDVKAISNIEQVLLDALGS